MTMPIMVAVMVPAGMDFAGFFKSPERPTPAVIPVKAGNMMANTTNSFSGSLNFMFKIVKSGSLA